MTKAKTKTKITILGCGTSSGVPLLGNRWGDCDPHNEKNRRRRSSILIEREGTRLLVDATPDLREQLLEHDISAIDALLITHCHADHIGGLDDLRGLNNLMGRPIELYGEQSCVAMLKNRIPYAFEALEQSLYIKPSFKVHELGEEGSFTVGAFDITYFQQMHGSGFSTGFRFGSIAYCTDVSDFSPKALQHLEGVELWIVDCLRPCQKHPSHAILPQILEWCDQIECKEALLTHLGSESDYETMEKLTPSHIKIAWDGLVLYL